MTRAWALVCCIALVTVALADGPRVVIISVDGLRADAISPGVTPVMAALRERGTRARQALCDLPTATLTNHASMLTGLSAREHGLRLNVDLPGRIPELTLFDHATAAGRRCAFLASKTKLGYLAPPEVLEVRVTNGSPQSITAQALELITAGEIDVLFLHFNDPDSTGHREGWMSAGYLEAAGLMDALVGEITAAIDADATRDTWLILTADHGGLGVTHLLNLPEIREVPWIVVGPGVAPGAVLDETVSTADTTPTALWLLGVDVPGGLSGRARRNLLPGGPPPASPLDAVTLAVPPLSLPCVILVVPAVAGMLLLVGRRQGR